MKKLVLKKKLLNLDKSADTEHNLDKKINGVFWRSIEAKYSFASIHLAQIARLNPAQFFVCSRY